MDWNRILSAIVALVYVGGAYVGGDAGAALEVVVGLSLPVACIWFGDEMGGYLGIIRGRVITTKSPGMFVRFGGWLILLLPLVIGTIMFLKHK